MILNNEWLRQCSILQRVINYRLFKPSCPRLFFFSFKHCCTILNSYCYGRYFHIRTRGKPVNNDVAWARVDPKHNIIRAKHTNGQRRTALQKRDKFSPIRIPRNPPICHRGGGGIFVCFYVVGPCDDKLFYRAKQQST